MIQHQAVPIPTDPDRASPPIATHYGEEPDEAPALHQPGVLNDDEAAERKEPLSTPRLKQEEQAIADQLSGRGRPKILAVTLLVFLITIAIVILSVVSNDNFGDDHLESYSLAAAVSEQEPRNSWSEAFDMFPDPSAVQYNGHGFLVQKKCKLPKRYFLQGFEILADGRSAIISSGLYRESMLAIMRFDIDQCVFNVDAEERMDSGFFAEGVSVVPYLDDPSQPPIAYQLVYKKNRILQWQIDTLGTRTDGSKAYRPKLLRKADMPMPNKMQEGWGIAYKNWVEFDNTTNEVLSQQQLLYTTDSSSKITVIDPKNWKTLRQIEVTENGSSVNYLNELEIIERDVDSSDPFERKRQFVRSQWVFANRFQSNFIYMVNLESGKIVHKWDMSELVAEQYTYIKEKGESNYDKNNNVLNGIAYKADTDSFLLSGKRWDFVFDVKLDYHKYLDMI